MNNEARLDELTQKIENHFDGRDPFVVPRGEPQVEEHVMDMFEIRSIQDGRAQLQHVFNDRIYSVTIGDKEIASLLRPRDVFLMAIVRRRDSWRVWHMSAPYETCQT
ncbi:MAG TPA: hypothetical protein PKC28_10230 [Bdellovibrionales bacterium]|nr:hypothetical protein [Bdellovibrionales bacterium]